MESGEDGIVNLYLQPETLTGDRRIRLILSGRSSTSVFGKSPLALATSAL